MKTYKPLLPGHTYHIFHCGNNHENLFYEQRNYHHFLKLYGRHVNPFVDTYAYCLLPSHFHLLIRVKEVSPHAVSTPPPREPFQHFSNFFNAYAKAINKAYHRSGSLFKERFDRAEPLSELHFIHLIFCIHFNPQKHHLVEDFRLWPWSSFSALTSNAPTRLQRQKVIECFGGMDEFHAFHRRLADEEVGDFIDLDD